MLSGLQIHFWERENACPLPCFDLALDPWSPEKVGLFQCARRLFQRRMIHVVTSTIMFCAIFAVFAISLRS